MRAPNPNLIRFVRPRRLQLWMAKKGILTGRWTQEQINEHRRRGAEEWARIARNVD
jgi:hypothetical protein